MSPEITVVVPAYNAASFVLDTIESVVSQTYGDWELLLIDDGSTDATADVVRSIADPRIEVLSGPNVGLAAARNRGLRAARGRYIAFLDADDLWVPTMLERSRSRLEDRPDLAAVGGRFAYLGRDGRTLGATPVPELGPAARARIARGEAMMPMLVQCALFRTEVVRSLGGFDEGLRRCEDMDLWARLATAHAFEADDELVGYYRIHPDSMTNRHYDEYSKYFGFIRARQRARLAGSDLSWDDFERAGYHPSLGERYANLVRTVYRRAAVNAVHRRWLSAAGYTLVSLLVGPRHTIRRLARQLTGNRAVSTTSAPGPVRGDRSTCR